MMPKPVCVPCGVFYRCKKNEFEWIEGYPTLMNGDAPPVWKPYRVWNSDLWECAKCGNQIVVGHAHKPFAEKHLPGFDEACERAVITVND